MGQVPIKIAIDISGVPYDKIFIGSISSPTYSITKIEKEFSEHLKEFERSKWKGVKLDATDLERIIRFFDERKIRMRSISISQQDWVNYKRNYGEEAFFKERLIAIYYFTLLRQMTFPESKQELKYDIVFCEESWMNINKALDSCRRISNSFNRNFDFSVSNAKHTKLLKFADYIAASHRKINAETLRNFNYFRTINISPDPKCFIELFKKYKK
ncbi:MAG: hypothetical protein HY516_02190 [Candidatus Aenigmarchaeota archaeon]|nr:hypothetical protein [Candidatus Aenigmarchaeota archaeon]